MGHRITLYIAPDVALPDNDEYTNRFNITSESSANVYTVAQHKKARYWSCDCHGWLYVKKNGVIQRNCKHLKSLGLPGHLQPYEPKIEGGSK